MAWAERAPGAQPIRVNREGPRVIACIPFPGAAENSQSNGTDQGKHTTTYYIELNGAGTRPADAPRVLAVALTSERQRLIDVGEKEFGGCLPAESKC